MIKKLILTSTLFTSVCTSVNALPHQNVIYGKDNRQEVTTVASPRINKQAKAVGVMVPNSRINKISEDKYTYTAIQLGLSRNLCLSERFYHQPALGVCSGFLVGNDVLVTAGHCMQSLNDCQNFTWVFNFTDNKNILEKKDIYKCKSIISQSNNRTEEEVRDYAIIQLDRPVEGATPLQYRKRGKVFAGTKLYMIGHPLGIPSKFTNKAKVKSFIKFNLSFDEDFGLQKHDLIKKRADIFLSNFDSYSGNSGSPVFNKRTGLVEGILIEGEADFVFDSDLGCMTSNRLSNRSFDKNEVVQRITVLPLMD